MNSFKFMKVSMVKMALNSFRKLANFQLSILQSSKRNSVVTLFDNLSIDNPLKIGNWKLKILGVNREAFGGNEAFICFNGLN